MRILYFQSKQNALPLAEACMTLTPKVSLFKNEIFMDIGITEKLFGGEASQICAFEKLKDSFESEGTLTIVDRPEWAKMFAEGVAPRAPSPGGDPRRRGPSEKGIREAGRRPLPSGEEASSFPGPSPSTWPPTGKSKEWLLLFPIERLRFCGDPSTLEEEHTDRLSLIGFMKRIGMRRISDFVALPLSAIQRRFGKRGGVLWEWTQGERELKLPPFEHTPLIEETIDTEDIVSFDALLFSLRKALCRIESRLSARGWFAKELKLTFLTESGKITKTLPLSQPLRESPSFLKLLQEFLRNLRLNSPFQKIELQVSDSIADTPGQLSLFDQTENKMFDLNLYIERLRKRFGTESAGFVTLTESYLPERSFALVKEVKVNVNININANGNVNIKRPLFLYSPPHPYFPSPNVRLVPSENLATEWWEGEACRRYFIAHTADGKNLWIFWDESKRGWFLHGIF